MELIALLRIVQRWLWLILSVVLVTALVLGFRLRVTEPVYEAQVKLQLTAPHQEDVALFDGYRSTTLRDEMTVARNNFIEVLGSREVYNRTIRQLGLQGKDAAYALKARPLRDSDFLYVTVRARTPRLAGEIANAHVSTAIEYYGEVRAKPATATKNFLAKQLRMAEEELRSAEEAFAQFQIQNGIAGLEDELAIYQGLVEQLQLERDRRLLEEPTGRATWPTDHVDNIIAKRRDELEHLVALRPMYNVLQENVRQARAVYQLLLNKYTEAVLKEDTVQAVSFIQVVEPIAKPALVPARPAPIKLKALLGLGLAGSLGLGILLAFLLESITGFETASPPEPVSAPARMAGSATTSLALPWSRSRNRHLTRVK